MTVRHRSMLSECCRYGWSDTSNGCDGNIGVQGEEGHVCAPASAVEPACARAVKLVADSYAPLLGSKSSLSKQVKVGFKDIVDQAMAVCAAAAAGDDTQYYVTTDSASSNIDSLTAAGSVLTDGMGAGGHGGSANGQDTTTLHQAAAGEVILEMLWRRATRSGCQWTA